MRGSFATIIHEGWAGRRGCEARTKAAENVKHLSCRKRAGGADTQGTHACPMSAIRLYHVPPEIPHPTFPMLVHLNSQVVPLEVARISPLDRGFLFGDGIYEGLRAFDGRV